MLEWKPDYETGVPEIDTQHKVLFDNINRLGKLLDKEKVDRAEADYLLKFLVNYAEQHFKGEETCMARYRCPAHGKNKEEHANFRTILGICHRSIQNRNHAEGGADAITRQHGLVDQQSHPQGGHPIERLCRLESGCKLTTGIGRSFPAIT